MESRKMDEQLEEEQVYLVKHIFKNGNKMLNISHRQRSRELTIP
jgi:hypothetical protein